MEKISVIVPVYKTEQFLNKCIDSILNQTYKNLEIILVNDGSPDRCPQICDEYAKKDVRIKVIHKPNEGLSSARNAGIDVATGEFIGFIDSDDWIDEEMYENLIKLANEHDADIAECGYRFIRPWKVENKVLDGPNTGDVMEFDNVTALEQLYFGPQLFSNVTIMVWDKIYKKNILNDIRFSNGIHEDVDFTPRVLYKTKKVVKIDKAYYNYNIHLGAASTSGMGVNYDKLVSTISMKKGVADFFDKHKLDKISKFTKSLYYQALLDVCYEAYLRRDQKQFKELFYSTKKIIYKNKDNIKHNEYMNKNKVRLFFVSPCMYIFFCHAVRIYREIKYKIKCKITGKN